MTKLFDRYFAFDGRFARLPFFIRDIYLGIACGALFMLSIPLFSAGNRAGYWSGLIVVGVSLALFCLGALSLFVRRLHDLGLAPARTCLCRTPMTRRRSVLICSITRSFWISTKT